MELGKSASGVLWPATLKPKKKNKHTKETPLECLRPSQE